MRLLLTLKSDRFVLDGELAIPLGNALSFDALQLRLHPAESRIRKLAVETPAIFIAFDLLLGPDSHSLMKSPLRERRAWLEDQFTQWHQTKGIYLSPLLSFGAYGAQMAGARGRGPGRCSRKTPGPAV